MRFISVDISNIGVYRGSHHFDLGTVDGPRKNLVVVYGRNGAGKSTLFKGIRLALYGKLALGDRVTQRQYQEYIARYLDDRSAIRTLSEKSGSVSVRFEFARSGKLMDVRVRRSWQLVADNLKEDLRILLNGRELDLLDDEYRDRATQELVFDYLPLELSDVCFFDAEQLDALSSPETHNASLGEVLRRFLGLDIVLRLHEDIQRYIDDYMRSECGSKEAIALRNEILNAQEQLEHFKADLESMTTQRIELSERKKTAEAALRRLERQLASQGGTYAEKRRQLQEMLHKLEAEQEHSVNDLADLCGGLLPFSLVPELLEGLDDSLRQESEQQRDQLVEDVFSERRKHLEGRLQSDDLWADAGITPQSQNTLLERLMSALDLLSAGNRGPSHPAIHHISDMDRQRISEWTRLALTQIPRNAATLCDHLMSLEEEISRARTEIDRAPEDSVLAPIHDEISAVQEDFNLIVATESNIQNELTTLKNRIAEVERELRSKRDKLIKAQSAEYNLDLANRSRLVLKTYEDALLSSKIEEIEESIVSNFNLLCHKSDLLSRVRIDPQEGFSVALYGSSGRSIVLSELSAGERQLYVVSLLWALRQVTKRDLPLLVDTPIAKLDEGHGWQLVHEYFPNVSGQVILFAHTKEMDGGLLDQALPYTARRYKLNYQDERGETTVECEHDSRLVVGEHALIME